MGNDQSIRHEPPPAGCGSPAIAKPMKSAMTRSVSIRSHALAGESSSSACEVNERKIRYLPNGLDRAHNGLIMPSRPVGNDLLHGNGIESPQWGWYINTTPPTPEMYHSRSSLKSRHNREKSDLISISVASSDNGHTLFDHAQAMSGPNRVFQGFKAGSNRPPVGWPSVPL